MRRSKWLVKRTWDWNLVLISVTIQNWPHWDWKSSKITQKLIFELTFLISLRVNLGVWRENMGVISFLIALNFTHCLSFVLNRGLLSDVRLSNK